MKVIGILFLVDKRTIEIGTNSCFLVLKGQHSFDRHTKFDVQTTKNTHSSYQGLQGVRIGAIFVPSRAQGELD